jgi:hypothetical protein
MQVIDWIDNGGWTDNPPCVHPVFRLLGIQHNDNADDMQRQALHDLTPRIMGTNIDDERLTRQLLGWLARQVFPIYEEWRSAADYDDGGAVLTCIETAERGDGVSETTFRQAMLAALAASDGETASYDPTRAACDAAQAACDATRTRRARAAWDVCIWTTRAAKASWWRRRVLTASGELVNPMNPMALLPGLLDEFDRLTGRGQEIEPLDYSGAYAMLAACREAIGSGE